MQDPTTMLEMGDLTAASRRTPRTISDTDLLARDDPTPQSTTKSGEPLPCDPQSAGPPDAADERSNTPPPNSGRTDGS
ncbi:hypothetical protein M407DRAFT_241159 [Tulasnella calospora MUT 4182]|uniref:Uncharacterized protein n=1 Tax=Tulasnella calospora MUT 4182 TaxID=1051891 RepID=A0A0C3QKP3_9AGAM|nr:hypothetical protein M407DRAFT_241159 [Tulasnella calospora MUT 4182]